MTDERYQVTALTEEERERLLRAYDDLFFLASSEVPSVRAAARTALSFVAQAINGQGIRYDLYSTDFSLDS